MTLATDTLYYIMDYSGNFYRTDANDQLVVANKVEASIFSYAVANRKIGDGQKSKFYFMAPAIDLDENQEEEETIDAENIEEDDINDDFRTGDENSTVRELAEGELIDEIEKNISEYDLSRLDWCEYLTHYTFIISNITEYRNSLKKAESDVDLKICDVLHYIELCDMDTDEAADLVELLKVLRENRREIKDELMRTEYFQKNVGTSANLAKAKEALKAVKGLETRKYTPRKYSELFEGCILHKRQRPKQSENVAMLESIPQDEEYDDNNDYAKERETMEYIRRETPFDGKDNDWMEFALKQAEFYKNADQYITNIRIDIDEIDDAIDELMDEIENTNCNVTQGYKMLKKLKDLRLQKKQKENELDCLYILTDHFDISAMVDECERNIEDMASVLGIVNDEENNTISDNEAISEISDIAV